MHRYQNLMVGLSRTEADAGLIRYAAMVAGLGTAKDVRFVHVLPSAAAVDHHVVLADVKAEVQAHFTGVPATVRVSHEVLHGPLMDQMLAYVAEVKVDLLLLGSGSEAPRRKTLARRLAMKAPCSLWLVPKGSPPALKRILIPVDFSEPGADCMRVATSMAQLSGHTECLALHAYFNEAVVTYEGYDEILRGEEAEAFRKFMAPIDCQGVKVTPFFEEGSNVAQVIASVADREAADLIVMATRGRSRSAAILLGSVAEEMIIETRLPLLVVKHFGARIGLLRALLDQTSRHGGELHTG